MNGIQSKSAIFVFISKQKQMKKNIVIFGLISGLIVTAFMLFSITNCYKNADFKSNEIVGYASMIIAFSFIFIGIKNFRDKYNNGLISFGKAFKIGLYITLIASSIYVLAWLVDYYLFVPDFMDKYTAHMLRETKSGGASQAEMDKTLLEMNNFKQLYRNPLFVILITYLEVLPVGLAISLISALILKRKRAKPAVS